MDDEKRVNILANISGDTAALLTEECAEEGRRVLFGRYCSSPNWCGWRYNSPERQPKSAEEYALDDEDGVIKNCPEWASKRALFEFFRAEIERDFEEYVNSRKGEDNADA